MISLQTGHFWTAVICCFPPRNLPFCFCMVQNESRGLSAEFLSETIWKQPLAADNSAVKTGVSRLRKILGDAFSIENDKQNGYLMKQISGD